MATQAAQFDLSTSTLDQPKTIAYGLVRGAGNLILQQELADKSRVAFYMLGEGPWDSIVRLWLNNKQVALPNTAIAHFHPGVDGEMGNGVAAVSTGGDQHVDQFFTLIPGGLDPITFSGFAWLALKVAPDPSAPSATLTVLADYHALQVRQFDGSGNQTAFAWTQNWAWNICDFLIRKFVLRESKANQPLVAAELARFDWPSFVAGAAYYDALLSLGQPRFSDGGVVFLNDSDTADRALEQMLTISRSYILERNGKLSLYADQARASVFTFTSDNVAPLSSKIAPSSSVASSSGGKLTFTGRKSNLRAAANRITATFRDLNIASGSSDDATRFAISTLKVDHEAHQRTVGARGPGLSVLPKITELAIDLALNTPERVWRIISAMLIRQLGDDVDGNAAYLAPFSADWTGYEDSLAVESGDVVTLDRSISEEFGGKLVEVLQVEEVPDGTRNFTGLEYMANAFPDQAPAQQVLESPTPGTGLGPGLTVDGSGNVIVSEIDQNVQSFHNLLYNGDFTIATKPNGLQSTRASAIRVQDAGNPSPNGWTRNFETAGAGEGFIYQIANAPSIAFASSPSMLVMQDATGGGGCKFASVCDAFPVRALVNYKFSAAFFPGYGGIGAGGPNTLPTHASWYFRVLWYTIGATDFSKTSASLISFVDIVSNSTVSGAQSPSKVLQAPSNAGFCRIAFYHWDDGTAVITAWNLVLTSVRCTALLTAFDLTPINTSGTFTGGNPLSQAGATTTINIAASTMQFGDGQISFGSGSVNPGVVGTYYIYADDPTYAGGAVSYQFTTTPFVTFAANGRIYFGKITTVGGGGGPAPTGGGSGGGRVSL